MPLELFVRLDLGDSPLSFDVLSVLNGHSLLFGLVPDLISRHRSLFLQSWAPAFAGVTGWG